MDFEDTPARWTIYGTARDIVITGSALHVLWGADSGPQTAEGLIAEHRGMLEQIARTVAPSIGGAIVIGSQDVEG